MKKGLIRLTDEKDIFYDSIEKVYRYRMHCPNCAIVISKCRCYKDIDILLDDINDGIADYACSSKCVFLLCGDWDELTEAMQTAGIWGKTIEELSEEESKIIMELLLNDYDFDSPGGNNCEI